MGDFISKHVPFIIKFSWNKRGWIIYQCDLHNQATVLTLPNFISLSFYSWRIFTLQATVGLPWTPSDNKSLLSILANHDTFSLFFQISISTGRNSTGQVQGFLTLISITVTFLDPSLFSPLARSKYLSCFMLSFTLYSFFPFFFLYIFFSCSFFQSFCRFSSIFLIDNFFFLFILSVVFYTFSSLLFHSIIMKISYIATVSVSYK